MSIPSQKLLYRDFLIVCAYFGFDAEYRKTIWNWINRSDRAARCYRQIAASLGV